jgi:hypothetical protein
MKLIKTEQAVIKVTANLFRTLLNLKSNFRIK